MLFNRNTVYQSDWLNDKIWIGLKKTTTTKRVPVSVTDILKTKDTAYDPTTGSETQTRICTEENVLTCATMKNI